MNKPQVGEQIRVVETTPYGEEKGQHICTIADVLSAQLRCTYEVARDDGGWTERVLWVFLRDVVWHAELQCWAGPSS